VGTVKLTIREVYGKRLIYPMNETAETFVKLVGRKTLGDEHVYLIESLGFNIELVSAYALKEENK
jgi:hypothetical protein